MRRGGSRALQALLRTLVMLRRLLLLILLAAPLRAQEVVEWTDAASCVGRICTMRGTVVAMEDRGPTYRLFFDGERRDVYLTLMRGWLVTWPDFVGHAIAATGPVDRFQGDTEMIVRARDAVVILDPAATPTAAAPTTVPTTEPTGVPTTEPTAAPTPAPTGELERLREDMRRLQEKIDQLEQAAPKEDDR
jgi:hypothetical protein